MKTKIYFLTVCLSALLISCENNNSYAPKPKPHLSVFKFKNPDYRNHLIVYDGNEHFVFINGNTCDKAFYKQWPLNGVSEEIEFTERFRNPFWELPDGWFLTDWAWGGGSFIHAYPDEYYGNVILTDVTVDNYKSYLLEGSYLFSKDLAHIKLPSDEIFEQRFIYIEDLLQCLYPDGNYPLIDCHEWNVKNNIDTVLTMSQLYYHDALFNSPSVALEETCLCEKAVEMDEYWGLLQRQLTEVINNGDWDSIWRKK